jgi:nicotinamide phosphoribosyltransferase
MSKVFYPATLLCDFYKVSHREQYPNGTETIYSTWIPRSNKYFPQADKVVTFGVQAFIKEYLINYFNENFFSRPLEDVISEYKRFIKYTLLVDNVDSTHIEELHKLGYLPIKLKSLKEGTLAPIKTPMLTVENTNSKFFWVTNYLETLISNQLWLPMTSATISYQYRKLLDEYALKTVGNTEGVQFQAHDFSMRGMGSLESSKLSGAGHLLNFVGTDTIPAIGFHEQYYNANIETELVGTSIPATEHSVMCSYGQTDEFELFKHLMLDVYPNGFFSVVSDTWDFWKVVGEYLPKLKNEIMNRDGRVVIRPDSGNPVDIICGKHIEDLTNNKWAKTLEGAKNLFYDMLMQELSDNTPHGEHGETEVYGQFKYQDKYYEMEIEVMYDRYDKQYYYIDESRLVKFEEFTPSIVDLGLIESLWDIFGGTITEKGYKLLDTHIGAIYGDSITLERAEEIVNRLAVKGFASTNIVFGVGSYTYQMKSRDSLGFAMKSTWAEVDGEERFLFKDPKTDDGTKKSLTGRVAVTEVNGEIITTDGLNQHTYDFNFANRDLLETVFENGKLVREQSLSDIRELIQQQ